MQATENVAAVSPPIHKKWPRRLSVIIPLAVVLGTLAVLASSAWPMLRPAREVRVVQAVFDRNIAATEPVKATTDQAAAKRNVPTVQAAGWLEAEPFFVACTALADGVVETMEVLEGERVEKGQVVARLVAEDAELRLRRAEAELANAQAELDVARVELAAAERAWDHPVGLERAVESSRASLAEARAELARLPSRVESAEATRSRLQEEYEQAEALRERRASTEIEVVIAKQRVAAQRAEVEAIRALQPVLRARVDRAAAELRAAERDLELRIADRRRLDAARAAVAVREAKVEYARTDREEAALELERMVIRSPITGYVQRRIKSVGDKVMLGMDGRHSAHLVHVYDPSKLQVRVDVPLADASHVYPGQRCEVVVEVLPDRTFRGEVLRSTHEADLQKNTLQFKVRVLDPDPILRPEMLTRVKFLPPRHGDSNTKLDDTQRGSRVVIPEAAVDHSAGDPRVWLVTQRRDGHGQLQPASISPLDSRDGWVRVAGAIQPGAVLSLDFEAARRGERVRIRKSSEHTEGGGA